MRKPTPSHLAVAVTLGIVAIALTGCYWTGTPTATPGTISTPTETPTASIAPNPTPTAGTPAIAVSIPCSTLVPAQVMYDFNPNFTLQAAYAPKAGTPAYSAAADRGTTCNWINDTSGSTIAVSVARPGSDEFAAIKKAAASGAPVTGYGTGFSDAAYFSNGRLDVFLDDYWLTADSSYFSSASDASTIMHSMVKQLH